MICSFLNCPRPVEGSTQFCATHNHAMRKAERDEIKNAGKQRKKIAKFSEKKADKMKPYAVLRRNYLKENPVCECNFRGCYGNSEEIHHCSESELDFLEVSTWKAVCRSCHNDIERFMSADERRKLGLLIDPVNKKFNEPHKI